MSNGDPKSWTQRRNRLQHDWLKNHYILKLGYYLNILDDLVEDAEFEQTFLANIVREWPRRKAEVLSLGDNYQHEMGPLVLFGEPPLDQLSETTQAWLVPVVDSLWRVRHPVDQWTERNREAVAAVDRAYEALARSVEEIGGRASRKAVADLLESCRDLAWAVANFPTAVRLL